MTWRIIKKCAPLNTSRRKCHMYLNEKVKIESCKGDNLLSKCFELINKAKIKTSSPFYGIIATSTSYVFTAIFQHSHGGHRFWSAQLMFCIISFLKQKSCSSKRRFYWIILREIFPVNTAQK